MGEIIEKFTGTTICLDDIDQTIGEPVLITRDQPMIFSGNIGIERIWGIYKLKCNLEEKIAWENY